MADQTQGKWPTPWAVKRIGSLTGPEWDVQDATGQTIRHLGNISRELADLLVAQANERATLRRLTAEMVRTIEGKPARDPFAVVDDMKAALSTPTVSEAA